MHFLSSHSQQWSVMYKLKCSSEALRKAHQIGQKADISPSYVSFLILLLAWKINVMAGITAVILNHEVRIEAMYPFLLQQRPKQKKLVVDLSGPNLSCIFFFKSVCLATSPIKKWNLSPNPFILAWPSDFTWPIECGRSNRVSVLNL